ncbi:MAG: enoyl-CoA hydratase/isomerase family protein [Cyclobacteriaceae bacterium]|nr:enoyl-CoA hydratase/isomerase family protein [Cyclobacteriaceae bacterium]
MSLITYAVEGRVGTITLNRPEKRNALNQEMVEALKQAFTQAAGDPQAKVIVLRAEGEAFCAGADLAYLQQLQKFSYEENLSDSRNLMQLYHLVYTVPKVVIACVEGHALAGGSGLVTVCDIAYSVPEAKFGYTEVRIGFIPALVSTFLIRKIGESKARELLLSGRIITADEAASLGMVTRVVSREAIRGEVKKLTDQLLTGASAQSLAATKRLLDQVQGLPLVEALELAAKENASARGTEDCKRGIAAFLEKKELHW